MARTAIRPSPLILDFSERADTASHNGKRILQCSLTTTNPRTERNGLHLDPVVTSERADIASHIIKGKQSQRAL